ncbi:MAG TPA: DNA recombination protein RmuC [Flavobacteriales bacterium]|nr:DNA recombination protein RmuC [Flavobacteriales bacterium]
MEWASLPVGLLAGMIAGAMAMAWWHRNKERDALQQMAQGHAAERQQMARQLAEREQYAQDLNRELGTLNGALGRERQRNEDLEEKLATQRAELEAVNEKMTKEFRQIASSLMEEKGQQLADRQEDKLKLLLAPFKERILEFQKQVGEAYDKEGRERFALQREIATLVQQNQQLSRDADNLTKALKGDSQGQGAWGEMILDKLLEDSGLVRGHEYTMQESTTRADGTRLRPDAVIHLPGDKHLIIDSKVSLVHYEHYCSTTGEHERGRMLRLHVDSMRTHAKGLGEKNYARLHGLSGIDFVLMFVPIEPAFLLALRERPEIFQEAYDRQVVMVTHSTLMATLRTIHGLWKNERIARNHMQIAERAGQLHDKFVGFTEDLMRIGKQIGEARDSYEKALGKLSNGKGSLVRQVEMLKDLGAKANKSLGPELLGNAAENGNHA